MNLLDTMSRIYQQEDGVEGGVRDLEEVDQDSMGTSLYSKMS